MQVTAPWSPWPKAPGFWPRWAPMPGRQAAACLLPCPWGWLLREVPTCLHRPLQASAQASPSVDSVHPGCGPAHMRRKGGERHGTRACRASSLHCGGSRGRR